MMIAARKVFEVAQTTLVDVAKTLGEGEEPRRTWKRSVAATVQ
jgi:hypothetical protein